MTFLPIWFKQERRNQISFKKLVKLSWFSLHTPEQLYIFLHELISWLQFLEIDVLLQMNILNNESCFYCFSPPILKSRQMIAPKLAGQAASQRIDEKKYLRDRKKVKNIKHNGNITMDTVRIMRPRSPSKNLAGIVKSPSIKVSFMSYSTFCKILWPSQSIWTLIIYSLVTIG